MLKCVTGAAGKSPGSQEVQPFTRTTSLSAASVTCDTSVSHGETMFSVIRCFNYAGLQSTLVSSGVVMVIEAPDVSMATVNIITSSVSHYPSRSSHQSDRKHLFFGWEGVRDRSGIAGYEVSYITWSKSRAKCWCLSICICRSVCTRAQCWCLSICICRSVCTRAQCWCLSTCICRSVCTRAQCWCLSTCICRSVCTRAQCWCLSTCICRSECTRAQCWCLSTCICRSVCTRAQCWCLSTCICRSECTREQCWCLSTCICRSVCTRAQCSCLSTCICRSVCTRHSVGV